MAHGQLAGLLRHGPHVGPRVEVAQVVQLQALRRVQHDVVEALAHALALQALLEALAALVARAQRHDEAHVVHGGLVAREVQAEERVVALEAFAQRAAVPGAEVVVGEVQVEERAAIHEDGRQGGHGLGAGAAGLAAALGPGGARLAALRLIAACADAVPGEVHPPQLAVQQAGVVVEALYERRGPGAVQAVPVQVQGLEAPGGAHEGAQGGAHAAAAAHAVPRQGEAHEVRAARGQGVAELLAGLVPQAVVREVQLLQGRPGVAEQVRQEPAALGAQALLREAQALQGLERLHAAPLDEETQRRRRQAVLRHVHGPHPREVRLDQQRADVVVVQAPALEGEVLAGVPALLTRRADRALGAVRRPGRALRLPRGHGRTEGDLPEVPLSVHGLLPWPLDGRSRGVLWRPAVTREDGGGALVRSVHHGEGT